MKNESTISVKGQTTVPAGIRKRFGCPPGTRLDWHVLDDGRLMVRVMTTTRTVKKIMSNIRNLGELARKGTK